MFCVLYFAGADMLMWCAPGSTGFVVTGKESMSVTGNASLLDLPDCPRSQREPLLWPTRCGPADVSTLVHSAGLDPADAQQACCEVES